MIHRRTFMAVAGAVAASAILPGDSFGAARGRRYVEKRVTLDSWWWKGDPTSTEIPVMLYARPYIQPVRGPVPGSFGIRKLEDGDGTVPKGSFWRVPLSDAMMACADALPGCSKTPTKTVVYGRFPLDKSENMDVPSSIVIGRYHLGPRGLTFREKGGNGKLAFGIRCDEEGHVTAAVPVSDVREVLRGLRRPE